jgi:hypothetical protein
MDRLSFEQQALIRTIAVPTVGYLCGKALEYGKYGSFQNDSIGLCFATFLGSSYVLFYSIGIIGERKQVKAWKVRLLQGISLGIAVGLITAVSIARCNLSPKEEHKRITIMIYWTLLLSVIISHTKLLDSRYLKKHHSNRPMTHDLNQNVFFNLPYSLERKEETRRFNKEKAELEEKKQQLLERIDRDREKIQIAQEYRQCLDRLNNQ